MLLYRQQKNLKIFNKPHKIRSEIVETTSLIRDAVLQSEEYEEIDKCLLYIQLNIEEIDSRRSKKKAMTS